jgi:hypothetical protein
MGVIELPLRCEGTATKHYFPNNPPALRGSITSQPLPINENHIKKRYKFTINGNATSIRTWLA